MYVTAREMTIRGRKIPKGTRLSDVYAGGPDDNFYAIAHFDGTQMKLVLRPIDLEIAATNN